MQSHRCYDTSLEVYLSTTPPGGMDYLLDKTTSLRNSNPANELHK